MTDDNLAVFGGPPVRRRPWPKWPLATPATQRSLLEVLHSGKWAISGWCDAAETFERRLARAFAAYVGRSYCVACSHGSAALSLALRALDIGPGDDVILTGLTWVACPSAVAQLGARPILVDIDDDGLCASAHAIERAITVRTRAILMIHMYSSICDVERYRDVANRHGIALIEDASQAHGASWRGRPIGSFGEISVFSTQQSKLLTSGEGGLCVTDDARLYDRLQQLRADGRRYRVDPFRDFTDVAEARPPDECGSSQPQKSLIAPDGYELEAVGDVAGQNQCLSEFQSAILLEGLSRLDQENAHRRTCVAAIATLLAPIEGIELLTLGPDVNRPTYYRLALRTDPSAFAGLSAIELVPALAAELCADVRRVDAPLNAHPLYVPTRAPLPARNLDVQAAVDPTQFALPNATRAHAEVVTLPHQLLLSAPADMHDIARALQKVRSGARALKERANELYTHSEI